MMSFSLFDRASTFDIVYQQAMTAHLEVMARDIEAVDRTHALLWYLRHELGLAVDPVEMFHTLYEWEAECGCAFRIEFAVHKRRRLAAFRLGEQSIVAADVDCTPCAAHARKDWSAPARSHRAGTARLRRGVTIPSGPTISRPDVRLPMKRLLSL